MSRIVETSLVQLDATKRTDERTGSLYIRAEDASDRIANLPKSDDRGSTREDIAIELAILPCDHAQRHSVDVALSSRVEGNERFSQRWHANVQFAAVCWAVLLIGWNDGTTGPLLPRIQSHYHVGYALVSLVFAFGCVGFVLGAIANVYLADKLGFGKVMVIGSLIQLIGYILQSLAPPYPVFCLAFVINGCGIALQDAGANAYVASLKDNSSMKMGILHSIYGTGLFLSPLSATQFSHLEHWSFQYLTSLGMASLNTISLITVFRFKRQEVCLAEVGQAREVTGTINHTENSYRQILRIPEVHYLAVFLLLTVGASVTIGGWSVTYMINVRGGGSNTGYVSSGFSGGVALGRIALMWVTKKLGERRAVFAYSLLAIALELVVWLVPSLIGGSIAVSFVGFFLGPLYPIVISHAGRILPHWLLSGSVGWIAGFAQSGTALLPLIAGTIASKKGIESLQPLLIAMMGAMILIWLIIPGTGRRID